METVTVFFGFGGTSFFLGFAGATVFFGRDGASFFRKFDGETVFRGFAGLTVLCAFEDGTAFCGLAGRTVVFSLRGFPPARFPARGGAAASDGCASWLRAEAEGSQTVSVSLCRAASSGSEGSAERADCRFSK